MSITEKQAVAHIFIERITVTQTGKRRVADVIIHWRDNSTDEFVLPYRADAWVLWTPAEVDQLRQAVEAGDSQIEIAASVPTRNWRAIRIKIYEIIGERKFHISPKPIRDKETYEDYMARVEEQGANADRTSGNRWTEEELEALAQAIENGVT